MSKHGHRSAKPAGKRKVPNILELEFGNIAKTMSQGTDVACVLVCAAHIENATGSLLEGRMIDHPKANGPDGLLNAPMGILAAASARSDLCFCLGLIDQPVYENAKTIAKIRNKFAHSYLPIDFTDGEVSDLCGKLKSPLSDPDLGLPGWASVSGKKTPISLMKTDLQSSIYSSNRQKFVLAACWTFVSIFYSSQVSESEDENGQMIFLKVERPKPPSDPWVLITNKRDGRLVFGAIILDTH